MIKAETKFEKSSHLPIPNFSVFYPHKLQRHLEKSTCSWKADERWPGGCRDGELGAGCLMGTGFLYGVMEVQEVDGGDGCTTL